jgi:phosphatidylinositol alpha-1,6-mannosyltransferase
MSLRHRVLLIAEAANPEWASVPLEGWSLARALANITDAHLVTQVRNREAILRAGLVEGRDFTTIDSERVAAPVWKISEGLRGGAGKGWTTVSAFSSLAYYAFEREVWRLFGARLNAHEFDLVHRITPCSPTSQSPIAKTLAKCGVPFLLGPLNGGVPWPKNFIDRQHAEHEWLSHVRSIYRLMPYYRATRKYSAAIIAGSKHTQSEIPKWAQNKTVYIPENGVDPERFSNPRTRRATLPLKGAFLGRLVPYKGADILLEAAADFLREGKLELEIIGDGPQRQTLETLASQLGIETSVHFRGWMPHQEVQGILRLCDFMALPSIREFGGGVVVEAMALGVAPIVADYGGPSELVDKRTGIRVAFRDKESLKDGVQRAIGDAVRAPEMLDELGGAGLKKVREKLTWQAKAKQIFAVYEAVLRGEKDLRHLDYHGSLDACGETDGKLAGDLA